MIVILILAFLIYFLPYLIVYTAALVLLVLVAIAVPVTQMIWEKMRYSRIYKKLRMLSSEPYLSKLTKEEKKRLARLIDLYHTNYTEFVKECKRKGIWAAAGWTISELGFDRTVRYGLGYVLIRRLLKKKTDDVF